VPVGIAAFRVPVVDPHSNLVVRRSVSIEREQVVDEALQLVLCQSFRWVRENAFDAVRRMRVVLACFRLTDELENRNQPTLCLPLPVAAVNNVWWSSRTASIESSWNSKRFQIQPH